MLELLRAARCERAAPAVQDAFMLAALLVLLLLVLLFGGLGLFVAKVFFVFLLVALLLSLVTGGMTFGRRNRP